MTTISIKNNNKKTRKIKNPLVNIEDVIIESGLDYISWIPPARTKLKEREIKLMKLRVQLCENTIISSIHKFTSENAKIFNKQQQPEVHIYVNRMAKENYTAYNNAIDNTKNIIINSFNESITQRLSIWQGYKPGPKTKSKINTFRDYFKGSRGWWDLRKVDIIAKNILIPIADMINKFAEKAASEFF
eukprot:476620_1